MHELPDGAPDGDGLTARQRLVLQTIRASVDQRGYPPSMREIGEAVGLTSPSSVKHQLGVLERKGYLKSRTEGAGRRARRYYRATRKGRAALAVASEKVRELSNELTGER